MIIIAGLGNPLPQYQNTRHNVGQTIVSYFRKKMGLSDFKFRKKIKSLISEGTIENKKILLALPQVFMNESGWAVKLLVTNSKLPLTNLWIVHDDMDLPLGKIRIRKAGSSAGHKGIESIIQSIKNNNFIRIRIGIGKPENEPIDRFVLNKFSQKEKLLVQKTIELAAQTIYLSILEGIKEQTLKI